MRALSARPTGDVPQRLFVAGLLLLFAAVSVQYSVKVLTPRNGETTRSAIVRWREQIQQLDDGENIYERFTYPNPPIMALLLKPIAELPPLTGALVWFFLKVGMVLASFALTFRLIEEPGVAFPPWAKALTVLLCLRPILGDLTHGNVNLLILLLVVLTLYCYRRGWDVAAGVSLALAIACKVTPALFVPYFLWKRAWKTLAGCALGLGLFFVAIPALYLGWHENLELLTSWTERMVVPFVQGGVVTSEHNNQSLPGLVFRMTTHSPSFSTYIDDQYTPVEYHNVLNLSPAVAKGLVKGLMLSFAVLVVATCRTPTQPRGGWRLAAEFGIIAVGMLLFSERTWKHHCVTLLVPFAVLCYALATQPLSQRLRGGLIAGLVAVVVLMSTTSTGLLPDDWAKLAQVYGGYVWAFVLLVVGLAVLLWHARTRVFHGEIA